MPVDAAISYYESSALPWERAAFIRARLAAGDPAVGRYFLDAIHPFIWRRSLDFGAIGEVRAISRRIRDHYAQGQGFGPGFDLKRGRGGIREIEFFAQIHQLIHGGREPALRASGDARRARRACRGGPNPRRRRRRPRRRLSPVSVPIEHRLQMVDDRQTHSLPAESGALDNVARLHGLADGEDLLALLEAPVARIASIYDSLDAEEGDGLPLGAERARGPACRAPASTIRSRPGFASRAGVRARRARFAPRRRAPPSRRCCRS